MTGAPGKLVLVDKDRLRALHNQLREVMIIAVGESRPEPIVAPDPLLMATGALIGMMAEVLDELLTEITGDRKDSP